MKTRIAAALLFLLLFTGTTVQADEFSLYLTRHAEKAADGSDDPPLTDAGKTRAEQLALWLAGRGLEATWSSQTTRTVETARPFADQAGLDIEIYDPMDAKGMAILLSERGQSALVVGHSNTIPALASELCSCPVEPIDESEYDRLYLVRFSGSEVDLELLDQGSLP